MHIRNGVGRSKCRVFVFSTWLNDINRLDYRRIQVIFWPAWQSNPVGVTVVLVLRSVFQRNTLNIVEKQQLYLYKWTVFDAFYTIWRTIEGKSRVKLVGELSAVTYPTIQMLATTVGYKADRDITKSTLATCEWFLRFTFYRNKPKK